MSKKKDKKAIQDPSKTVQLRVYSETHEKLDNLRAKASIDIGMVNLPLPWKDFIAGYDHLPVTQYRLTDIALGIQECLNLNYDPKELEKIKNVIRGALFIE